MKKLISQLFVAIVCGILGFLLAYQFKVLAKTNAGDNNYNSTEMVSEIESLKKEKEELLNANTDLTENLKKFEDSAANSGDVSKEITTQLEAARMQLGTADVKGKGLIVTITPKPSVFGTPNNDTTRNLGEDELVHIANILWFGKAEAVSINDYRITAQTGIKNSGSYVWVGPTEKINPEEKIVFEAIGDKTTLKVGLTWPGALDYKLLGNYNVEIVESDEILIEKTSQTIKNNYIRPVK
ncbi:DUF881 domain-containing protein [Clostridium paraputrificum]|uniref:DUF881 domain-containing protein n=1 Tax=Clostridium TaxID=1485 RepID=UPI003D33F9D8